MKTPNDITLQDVKIQANLFLENYHYLLHGSYWKIEQFHYDIFTE